MNIHFPVCRRLGSTTRQPILPTRLLLSCMVMIMIMICLPPPGSPPPPQHSSRHSTHSTHSTQPALRPHCATPRAEHKPPQTRRPHLKGPCSYSVTAICKFALLMYMSEFCGKVLLNWRRSPAIYPWNPKELGTSDWRVETETVVRYESQHQSH